MKITELVYKLIHVITFVFNLIESQWEIQFQTLLVKAFLRFSELYQGPRVFSCNKALWASLVVYY